MSSSLNQYSSYGYGKNNTGLRNDVQKMRRRLQEIEWKQEREQLRIDEEERKTQELEKWRKAEAERKETERKTKRYFAFDTYDRKKLVKDRSYYFGDFELSSDAWRPNGMGQFFDQDQKLLQGKFRQGDFQGGSVYFRTTEQSWQGNVKYDIIQGKGTIISKSYREKTAKDMHFGDDQLEPGSYATSSNNSVASHHTSNDHNNHNSNKSHAGDSMKNSGKLKDEEEDEVNAQRRKDLEEHRRKNMVEIVNSDEVLAYNGEIICKRDELIPGLRIEFYDDQYARVGISDSTQLSTTNLSPPRYTRNSALHKTQDKNVREDADPSKSINSKFPVLQLHHVPGPFANLQQPKNNTAPNSTAAGDTSSIVTATYERNPGPKALNSLDRGHFSMQASIIEHRRDWKYLVRLDDEVYPRDRILDFQHLGRFRILREQPRIYHLHSFPAVFSNRPQNNTPYHSTHHRTSARSLSETMPAHHRDTSSQCEVSTLGGGDDDDGGDSSLLSYYHSEASATHSSTVSYNAPTERVVAHPDHPRHTMDFREHLPQHLVTTRALLPVVPSRSAHAKRSNYFETALMGYGSTQEAEELKERRQQQQLQWRKFITEKKQAFEQERQRQIEAEQARQLQSSIAKDVESKLRQKQQEEDDDEQTRQSALTSIFSEFGDVDEEGDDAAYETNSSLVTDAGNN